MSNKKIYQSKLGTLITPYKKKQSYAIEKNTGIYDQVYHKYNEYVGFILPYRGRNSYFTYNRDYAKLSYLFPDYDIEKLPIISYRNLSNKFSLTSIKAFRPAQTEIIGHIMESKKNENVWFINLQTGFGKTLLSVYLSSEFNLKTWILCYSDEILKQWISEYLDKTNIDPRKILRVTGLIIDKILAGTLDPSQFDIFLCTPTLLDRFGNKRGDYSRISDLFNKCGIGLLIYDEAHRNVSNIVKINSVIDVRYQLYLSADFGQGDYEKELMYKEIFRNVPILTPSDNLKKTMKYTKLMVVAFNSNPNEIENHEPFTNYGFNAELYMRYQFKKDILPKSIIHILNKILSNNDEYRSLILFNNIEHVDIMTERLREKYPDIEIGRFHGSMPASEKELTKDQAKIIVATYSSFSTGLDVSDIKYVLSTNQCNKITDNQSAGRARPLKDGSNAIYIMFIDEGFSYCKRKLRIRLHYLNETKSKDEQAAYYRFHPDIHNDWR